MAQESLDQLRAIVGLPPLYSKLVSPAGINALVDFWNKSNLLPAVKASLNPNQWIWEQLKKIFNLTPPTNTVTTVLQWLIDNNIIGGTGQVGPPTESGQAPIPPIQDPSLDEDIRGVTKKDPPSSTIILFNLYNAQLRAQWSRLGLGQDKLSQQYILAVEDIKRVESLMYELWQKYNLTGKVNDSWYGVRADPFTTDAAFKLL